MRNQSAAIPVPSAARLPQAGSDLRIWKKNQILAKRIGEATVPVAAGVTDSPEAGSATSNPIPGWMLSASVASVLLSAAIYAVVYVKGAGFEELFKGFGADLPAFTRVVLASYKWYGVLLLVGIVPTVALFRNRKSFTGNRNLLFAPVVVSFHLSLLMLSILVAAAYLPIFQLGSALQ